MSDITLIPGYQFQPTWEQRLIARAAEGDRKALEALVRRYNDRVYSIALTFTRNPEAAQDLTQEAWVRVLRSLGSFRGDCRFSTWMYRIIFNLFLNQRRKSAREVLTESEPTARRASTEQRLTLQEAVRELPLAFREVVALRYVGDLSYKEIAEVLDVPLGTVQSRLKRGLNRLQKLLREKP